MFSRAILAAALWVPVLCAQPPLTTIQDVLYKADGTRFNGSLTISWSSFEVIDRTAIAQQTTTVSVVDGNLRVQLVPTTTANPAGRASGAPAVSAVSAVSAVVISSPWPVLPPAVCRRAQST